MDTSLDAQISAMEKTNELFFTPLGMAIINSLKELKAIKTKNIPVKNEKNSYAT